MARQTLSIEEKQRKQQTIIDSALELFATRGYDTTTMGDIAKSAGMSIGTLYLYFESKIVIFALLYKRALDLLEKSFGDALEFPSPDVKTKICMLLYTYINFYKNNHNYYRVLSSGFMSKNNNIQLNETLTQKGLSILKKLERPIAEGIEQGVIKPCDTFKTVVSLWVMFDGILMLPDKTHVDSLSENFQEYYSYSIDIILNGLLA
ncbi:MAG: TetR/AcrR family transcriptional regulator [Oscillospiraceae bacterium]